MSELSENDNKASNIPAIFKNKKVIKDIIKTLYITPGSRSMYQLRKLSSFLESCNIFKNIQEPDKLRELCNCVRLVECFQGEVVFR